MIKLRKVIILSIISLNLFGQSEVQFSHFVHTGSFVNPALCGTKSGINLSLISRNQWVGFEDPPSTQLLNLENQFEFWRSGIGLIVLNDKLGQENKTWFKGNYSYHFKLNHFLKIHGGLSFGLINLKYNATNLVYEEFDPSGIYTSLNTFLPNIGFGTAFFYKSLNTGFSFSKTFDNNKDDWEMTLPNYYYAFLDYSYRLLPNTYIIPSLYWQKTTFISSYILGMQGLFVHKIYTGLFIRKQESFNIQLGYRIKPKISIGYGYDLSYGDLSLYHNGSHEIYINININPKDKEYFYHKSPRFF